MILYYHVITFQDNAIVSNMLYCIYIYIYIYNIYSKIRTHDKIPG